MQTLILRCKKFKEKWINFAEKTQEKNSRNSTKNWEYKKKMPISHIERHEIYKFAYLLKNKFGGNWLI